MVSNYMYTFLKINALYRTEKTINNKIAEEWETFVCWTELVISDLYG